MAYHYKVLNKAPVLLPFFYLWRPFDKLFKSPKSVKRFMKMNVHDSETIMDQYKDDMSKLGLETMVSNYENSNK